MNAPHDPETQAILAMTADTIGKDLLGALVAEIKLLPDVWPKMSEAKQNDVIDRLRKRVEDNVRMACHLIASEGRSVVMGDLESVNIKDGIKAVLKVGAGNAQRHDLFDAVGKACLLVVADSAQHLAGIGEVTGESDQRNMDLGHEYKPNSDGEGMDASGQPGEAPGLPSPDNVTPTEEELQAAWESGYQAAGEGVSKDDCPVMRHELVAEWQRGFAQWHDDNQPA